MTEKRFTYGETIDYNFFDVFEEKKICWYDSTR